jgi:hypothetical protein
VSKLSLEGLTVMSFETVGAVAFAATDTEQADCQSPRCALTEGRTCPDGCQANQIEEI